MADRLDQPRQSRRSLLPRPQFDEDASGKVSESIARFLGTPRFIIWLTVFCAVWLAWNANWGPDRTRFDNPSNGFTVLTLMLSLQASYAAPLILLAQNRQADRDRVQAEQDRQRAERNLADTEFLAREMASLRIALSEVATRDFVRSELRDLLDELAAEQETADDRLRADQAQAERAKAERAKAERAKAARAKAARAKEDRAKAAEEAKAERARAEQAKEDRAKAEQAKEDRAKEDRAKEDRAKEDLAREQRAREQRSREQRAREARAKADKPATPDDPAGQG